MDKRCILILGGARSGKSRFAQEVASRLGERVLFVATAEALDEEMRQRIEEHKKARSSSWRTIEAPFGVGRRIREQSGDAQVVVLDCLTLLVSNVIGQCSGDSARIDTKLVDEKLSLEVRELAECIEGTAASFVLVSNEVGMGLVPPNRLGRIYQDSLGKVNQELAQRADTVYLMVAGIPVMIKGLQGL
ncbi:MAG: bifunctional adenosylcobinamide kinase/adenosylcobinamide-phosphate guanylyltransferase [Chloroflexi bacterium]|nr:bifunctional adenosylcobinamide kinase/adenosylcobinamide-phosphate guanylyltransferase [Chloroflexota bacterium]